MSNANAVIALRLQGTMQSWGAKASLSSRGAGVMPSKSGVIGMIAAALGLHKGSERELSWLPKLTNLKMLSIQQQENEGVMLNDLHTISNSRQTNGALKSTHLTNRMYHVDTEFFVMLEGCKEVIEDISKAVKDPVWGITLGRRSCPPSAPIFAGTYNNKEEALSALNLNRDLCWTEEDVTAFEDGNQNRDDVPITFGVKGSNGHRRAYSSRRVLCSKPE